MSQQYDVLPGFDLASVTNPTRTQHIQAISQLAPLSNISFIIWQAGPSNAASLPQGVGGAPDVTNNPRFARYGWINTFTPLTPAFYLYDGAGNWVSSTIAAGSIVDALISATAEIQVSKLKDGNANEIIRTDGAGTGVEWVSVATLLAALNDSVPLTAIDDTAAVGAESFLRRVGSTVVWKTFAETVTAIQAALSAVSPAVLSPGANNTLLGTNGSGAVAFNTPANILANEAITLALLAAGGGSALQVLARNSGNTAWSPQTLALNLLNAATISTTGIVVGVMGGAAVFTQAHGLGGVPKLIYAVARNDTADVGYVANDELDVHSIRDSASGNVSVSVSADATNIVVTLQSAAGNAVPNKGTGVYAAMAEANWSLKLYAWK